MYIADVSLRYLAMPLRMITMGDLKFLIRVMIGRTQGKDYTQRRRREKMEKRKFTNKKKIILCV